VPLLVGLAYYLGAQFAFLIGTLSDQVFALFWPPNVILFCALLFRPRREWLTLITAAFVAHVAAEVGVGMGVPQLLVAFATNCLVALLNAYAVRRLLDPPPWLGTFRRMGTYILITAGISPAFAALGGGFVPILGGGSIQDYWVFWSLWYLANALPSVTLGPVLMIWLAEPRGWLGWKGLFHSSSPRLLPSPSLPYVCCRLNWRECLPSISFLRRLHSCRCRSYFTPRSAMGRKARAAPFWSLPRR
jgi:integral membrane sensor domain MASE1